MTKHDSALPVDILDIIREFGKENRAAITDAVDTISRGILEARSASEFVTGSVVLNPNTPVRLLGYDRARVRSLVRSSTARVFVGALDQLSGGLGYELANNAGGDELRVFDEVYAVYIPVGAPSDPLPLVSVWTERRP